MPVHPMAAVDAQFYWMAAKIPSDQFLLYAFAGEPAHFDAAADAVSDRARACPALTMRVDDGNPLTYPRWVSGTPPPPVIHRLDRADWTGCLDAVAALGERQLDARVMPWRLHLFPGVTDIPGAGTGTVAVLQVAHALADGGRASALAAWLFGRPDPVPDVPVVPRGFLPRRAVAAARAHRRLDDDIAAGVIAAKSGSRPLLSTNAQPDGPRTLRTVVRRRAQLTGPTVTIAVLTAVGTALAAHLDEPTDTAGAEVPMAKPGPRLAHNHFHNVSVGLYPRLDPAQRAERIADELTAARRRAEHPATAAADRAFAAVPAPLLRWGVGRFDAATRPDQVSGNTVVSSVHRGPADLRFGDTPVVLTAGYPALSPAMGLTHGVHGIGDTVAISVHAAHAALDDVDAYLRHLEAAL
ncbi:WS/DGAT domain-containing protein [Mycolicibacillus trivialis]|nr:WS/DGAT domain-containing protein [Mycolicibacillus trivialis]